VLHGPRRRRNAANPAGTPTPAGNLPAIDIQGHRRSYNGAVDIGAYKCGNPIYSSAFDS